MKKTLAAICAVGLLISGCGAPTTGKQELLNVSSEPTREFYAEYNERFKLHWEHELWRGEVTINQSHGASSKQADAVIDGTLQADVVTLTIPYDVTKIKNAGLIRGGWRLEFPHRSTPCYSTIVFLVRAGNPKEIHDWNDLTRPDVQIVTPNPKTSGGARWNYLTAWEYARRTFDGEEAQIIDFMRAIYKNVVAMDDGVRGSRVSFQRGKGDVLIAWESEALSYKEDHPKECEIVTPSLSIVAELPVAIVDKVVLEHGTQELAMEYLNYLYSPAGQEIAAKNYYRPQDKEILFKYRRLFQPVELFTIDDAFGSWVKAYNDHFADGAMFDKISREVK